MRLILVRHGESASNRREDVRILGEQRGDDAGTETEAEREASDGTGDTYLTENGHMQVEAFGAYWAPILHMVASQGKLHVVCRCAARYSQLPPGRPPPQLTRPTLPCASPMRRNLQTAAPLLRELEQLGSPVTASVRWGNFECMGILHPNDDAVQDQLAYLL